MRSLDSQIFISGVGDGSQNGEQNLLSQNLALQDQVEELSLRLRLQEQHIGAIQQPQQLVCSNVLN